MVLASLTRSLTLLQGMQGFIFLLVCFLDRPSDLLTTGVLRLDVRAALGISHSMLRWRVVGVPEAMKVLVGLAAGCWQQCYA